MDSGIAGIIGAVAGAIVGALIVIIPQHAGKLRVTITSAILSIMGYREKQSPYRNGSKTVFTAYIILKIEANIHNSKSHPLAYSDISLEVSCENEKRKLDVEEEDQITRKFSELKILNIPSNSFVNCKLECVIKADNYDFIMKHRGKEEYYLCMKSYKNRLIRTLIPNTILTVKTME